MHNNNNWVGAVTYIYSVKPALHGKKLWSIRNIPLLAYEKKYKNVNFNETIILKAVYNSLRFCPF